MSYSAKYLRQFVRAWQDEASTTRIYFPDPKARLGLLARRSCRGSCQGRRAEHARNWCPPARPPAPAALLPAWFPIAPPPEPACVPSACTLPLAPKPRLSQPTPAPPNQPLQELAVALQGKSMDPNAGSWTLDPVFDGTRFKFGYLMKPNAFLDMGITVGGWGTVGGAGAAAAAPPPPCCRAPAPRPPTGTF